MEIAKILINYPELFAMDENGTSWTGYLTFTKSSTYRISLKVPKFPSTENLTYSIPSLTDSQTLKQLTSLTQKFPNIHNYLKQFYEILKNHSNLNDSYSLSNRKFYRDLIDNYRLLQHNPNVLKVDVNPTFTKFQINFIDLGQRTHELAIDVTSSNKFKVVEYDLPKIGDGHQLLKETSDLKELFRIYCGIVGSLQQFFDAMECIDNVCWVIDPEKPSRRDYGRRIVIGHNISIQITFEPWNVFVIPKIQFMGSDVAVTPFRDSYINNLENWDPEYDIVQNILRLLDLPFFPMAPSADDEKDKNDLDFELNECCICFCVRLNEQLPDQICKNPSCEQHFHVDCLYEWLSAVGTFHPNCQLAQGECPNCKTAITCPIPKS